MKWKSTGASAGSSTGRDARGCSSEQAYHCNMATRNDEFTQALEEVERLVRESGISEDRVETIQAKLNQMAGEYRKLLTKYRESMKPARRSS